MTYFINSSFSKKLEQIFNKAEPNSSRNKLVSIINSIGQRLVAVMTKEQELQIWQSSDRSGKTLWHGYDPVTGHSVCRDSEAEMRIWLEERYYK
jgi:hypothetical protein